MIVNPQEIPAFAKGVFRITEFEGLRAILAWYIVLGHALQYSGFSNLSPKWVLSGNLAVDIFIILSGFVIFLVLDGGRTQTYFQYMCGRFFRIYPVYLVSVIAAIIFLPLKLDVFRNAIWTDAAFAKDMLSQGQNTYAFLVQHLLVHLTLLHGLFPDQILPDSSAAFLGTAWSLSLEWQFYLVAPLLLLLVKRSATLALIGSLLIINLGRWFQYKSGLTFGHGAFLLVKIDFFIVGMASYLAYKACQAYPEIVKKYFSVAAFSTLILLALCSFSPVQLLSAKAIPLVVWLLVLFAAIAKQFKIPFLPLQWVSNFLNQEWLQSLGRVSYSTYLIHVIVMWILMWFSMDFIPDSSPLLILTILLSLGSAITVFMSFFLNQFIEKPGIKLGKNISKKLPSVSF